MAARFLVTYARLPRLLVMHVVFGVDWFQRLDRHFHSSYDCAALGWWLGKVRLAALPHIKAALVAVWHLVLG
jgi:hypothetical protein